MIYNNLLYLLAVVFLLGTAPDAGQPLAPAAVLGVVFLVKIGIFFLAARRLFRGPLSGVRHYQIIEQRLSVLAVLCLAMDLYLLDAPYFFSRLPGAALAPTVADAAGIGLFFLYLCLVWLAALPGYRAVFGHAVRPLRFLLNNLGANLPIVLPWLFMSALMDALRRLPFPWLSRLLATAWGDLLVLVFFFILLATLFPVLIRRLWRCVPLPPGALADRIADFCHRHRVRARTMLWPLFEGRVLTAGIMGFVGRFRYLLLTPALLEALTPQELEAVLAHEIGHVKRRHLQLYLLLFLGFAVLASHLAYPLPYLLLSSPVFYRVAELGGIGPEAALTFWGSVPLFVLMLVYFRFVFGFFMRNFERQADLYVFQATTAGGGIVGAWPLISSLEKVGWLSGNIRDQPSWHHFGIAQRVRFLRRAAVNPLLVAGHDRKVRLALLLYLAGLALAVFLLRLPSYEVIRPSVQNRYAESVLRHKIAREPERADWQRLYGDFLQDLGRGDEAVAAYERALVLKPSDPVVLNNLAWVLVADREGRPAPPSRRNAARALLLATRAATVSRQGSVLDTLAEAYWANGMAQEAQGVEKEAMQRDPGNMGYYRRQLRKFMTETYPLPVR